MASIAYGTGRQALLEAAIRVVATQGLRGLTYRSVAAEAGVTHGSVRYHFGDWESLVEAALQHAAARSVADATLHTDSSDLAGFAAGLAGLVIEDPETQAFQYELALEARRRTELLPAIERHYETYRTAVLEALTEHGIDDPDLAWAVMAALDGLVFHQTVSGDSARTERAVAALRTLLAAAR